MFTRTRAATRTFSPLITARVGRLPRVGRRPPWGAERVVATWGIRTRPRRSHPRRATGEASPQGRAPRPHAWLNEGGT